MRVWRAILIVSLLGLGPGLLGAGTAGTTGEQPPEQQQTISTDDFKLIQQRLTAEGVYAGPINGELNAQTAAPVPGETRPARLGRGGRGDAAGAAAPSAHQPLGGGGPVRPRRANQGP
jgi:hypothetical protein